jgi:hypothetical protein
MRLVHPPLRLSIFYGSRDQPRPGSFLKQREEPGNEVARSTVGSYQPGHHQPTVEIFLDLPNQKKQNSQHHENDSVIATMLSMTSK